MTEQQTQPRDSKVEAGNLKFDYILGILNAEMKQVNPNAQKEDRLRASNDYYLFDNLSLADSGLRLAIHNGSSPIRFVESMSRNVHDLRELATRCLLVKEAIQDYLPILKELSNHDASVRRVSEIYQAVFGGKS